MPCRNIPLVTDQIYHIYNRSVASQLIYHSVRDYNRFYELINYYRYTDVPMRFSFYSRATSEQKIAILNRLNSLVPTISILAYTIMPNHFHLIVRQEQGNGISTYMRKVLNGYAKYYNVKYKRSGALFQSMFKSVRIETDEQLLHVVRYVHLNPLTDYILKTKSELVDYKWSSYRNYEFPITNIFCEATTVMSHFKSIRLFREFTFDQIDYQRVLSYERHIYQDSYV